MSFAVVSGGRGSGGWGSEMKRRVGRRAGCSGGCGRGGREWDSAPAWCCAMSSSVASCSWILISCRRAETDKHSTLLLRFFHSRFVLFFIFFIIFLFLHHLLLFLSHTPKTSSTKLHRLLFPYRHSHTHTSCPPKMKEHCNAQPPHRM